MKISHWNEDIFKAKHAFSYMNFKHFSYGCAKIKIAWRYMICSFCIQPKFRKEKEPIIFSVSVLWKEKKNGKKSNICKLIIIEMKKKYTSIFFLLFITNS